MTATLVARTGKGLRTAFLGGKDDGVCYGYTLCRIPENLWGGVITIGGAGGWGGPGGDRCYGKHMC